MLSRAESARIHWQDAPPPSQGFLRIWRPKAGETLRLVALADKIEGTEIHFWEGRSLPCPGPFNHCLACKHRKPRWEGWLMAFNPHTREIGLAAITKGARSRCRELQVGIKLRGRRFELERIEGRQEARVELRIGDPFPRRHLLPEAPDTREALARIWGIPWETPVCESSSQGPPEEPEPPPSDDEGEIGGEG